MSDSNKPLTFDQFLNHTTDHYVFMLTELKKNNNGSLLDEWLTRITDSKNDLPIGDYLDFMLGSINNLHKVFAELKDQFPDEYKRVFNLALVMWQISDELRLKFGIGDDKLILPIDPNMPHDELINRGKTLKTTLFAYMQILEKGFCSVTKIVDRNLIIQWAGIYYYNYYGFQSLTLVQPGQTQQIKDQFEVIVRKILSRCPV